jgi:tetratricopeptide (TPR) repeat protein
MEILLFFFPSFLHAWLIGDISFTKTPEDMATKNFSQGISLFKEERVAEAFVYLKEKLNLYPKSAYLHLYIGKCHYYFENYEEALKSFDMALRYESTILDLYTYKAYCHYHLEQWKEAHFQLKKASRFLLEKNEEILGLINDVEKRTLHVFSK